MMTTIVWLKDTEAYTRSVLAEFENGKETYRALLQRKIEGQPFAILRESKFSIKSDAIAWIRTLPIRTK